MKIGYLPKIQPKTPLKYTISQGIIIYEQPMQFLDKRNGNSKKFERNFVWQQDQL